MAVSIHLDWAKGNSCMRHTLSAITSIPILALFSLVSQAEDSGVSIDESTNYYTIAAGSVRDLKDAMYRAGPVDSSQRHNDAYTDWYVRWHYQYDPNSPACRIGYVTSIVTIRITFPQIDDLSKLDHSTREKWIAFSDALKRHEDGHRDLAVHTAKTIDAAIEQLPMMEDCDTLDQKANELGQSLLEKAREEERNYDRDTGHGVTQGARLD